mgnify:CR=1 FL=1
MVAALPRGLDLVVKVAEFVYADQQRMLYSTEKSTNSATEFVKMVVESQ